MTGDSAAPMDTSSSDPLLQLAAAEVLQAEMLAPGALIDLVTRGLIRKDDRPKQASLESQYERLQDRHREILEARGCVDRLQRRMAPRSLLSELLPLPTGGTPPPGPEDPDVVRLFGLLESLGLQVRGVANPRAVVANLPRILDHLHVEGRECLDRLADTDRQIDLLQKQAPPGTLVEPEGFFVLTPEGDAALPEAPVVEAFEAALQGGFGPLALRGPSASHFRADPANLLAYLMEGMARGERPSALISAYDDLLVAFERVGIFSEVRTPRAKIAFLIRLLRSAREEPKRAFLWCSRERLNALAGRMGEQAPASLWSGGWYLPYAVDLFLADGNLLGDEEEMDRRARLMEAVRSVQSDLLQEIRITDGQCLRLALALMHLARTRNFAPGILLDRFLRQAFEVIGEAVKVAPYDLGDRGTRLLFGAHLAHAAGYQRARLDACLDAYRALQARVEAEPHGGHSHASTLHAFATLDRLERLGTPLSLDTYLGLRARLHKRLNHHKPVSRVFRTDQILAGDEAALLANLTARACFQGLVPPEGARHHPDVGLAGLYEPREPGLPPVLGSPFGSLMLI